MKGIEVALEGALEQGGREKTVTVPAVNQAVIKSVHRIALNNRATTEESEQVAEAIQKLERKGRGVKLAGVESHKALEGTS